jgi:hypothetical protein
VKRVKGSGFPGLDPDTGNAVITNRRLLCNKRHGKRRSQRGAPNHMAYFHRKTSLVVAVSCFVWCSTFEVAGEANLNDGCAARKIWDWPLR